MPHTLEIQGLSISFTQYKGSGTARRVLHCVRGLDLTADEGEITALVGASGSGKSLLAHAIMGLLPYNALCTGSIHYQGQPLNPERTRALRGREVVLVPQGVGYLDPLMKVGPQLTGGCSHRKGAVAAVLARYGLGMETAEKYPFELSGGMTRRVLISSAVLESPRLVVADEPTPGLDEPTARRVMGHFREMAKGGASVLLITHDLALAAATADRVAVLRNGVKAAEFHAGDFGSEKNLRDPYVSALWHAMPEHDFAGGKL